eukprot:GEMP01034488.1.p1 GENE.GEMP01034488.1~~GEMP01034488.1.p1  ORF type:complete len:456 (+),score=112.42 GEMP01034488.1:120-1487(+)
MTETSLMGVLQAQIFDCLGLYATNTKYRPDELATSLQRAASTRDTTGIDPRTIDLSWSKDAESLVEMVSKLGVGDHNLRSLGFLKSFFTQIKLPNKPIAHIDFAAAQLINLTDLDISQCKLTQLQAVPPKLRYMKAYNNQIYRLHLNAPSLVFLGLGHNRLRAVDKLTAPNLLCLDLSFNDIVEFDAIAKPLTKIPLHQLTLYGCPLCIQRCYRATILGMLPQLQHLDAHEASVPIGAGSKEHTGTSKSLADAMGEIPQGPMMKIVVSPIQGLESLLDAVITQRGITEEEEKKEALMKLVDTGHCEVDVELIDGSWHTMSLPADGCADLLTPMGEDVRAVHAWLLKGLRVKVSWSEPTTADAEAEEDAELSPPNIFPLGAAVLPLMPLLKGVETRIVSRMPMMKMEHWLDPEVQVPEFTKLSQTSTTENRRIVAEVLLFQEEEKQEEEPQEPVEP